MPGFMPDSNCIVAVISRQHVHHERAMAEIDRRLSRGENLLLAAHSLVETYSVLTRIPEPARISPAVAWRALYEGFVPLGRVFSLSAEDYVLLLRRAAGAGIVGGAVYDAIIASCAGAAHAEVLLTFNERHFLRFASPTLEIVVPSA